MTAKENKSILIVGSNGGLGKATTKALIEDGFGEIVMAARSEEKVIAAKEGILVNTKLENHQKIETVSGFDMNDPAKIEAAITSLKSKKPFDMIFLGAGGVVFADDFQTVKWNGKTVEKTIFQNVIGSHITLSHLKKNRMISQKARVVMAGGEGARGIPGMIERPSFLSPEELRKYVFGKTDGTQKYNPVNAIGVSKLLGAIWIGKLALIEAKNFTSVWFTPGLTYGTSGLSGMSPAKRWLMENIGFGFMRIIGKAQSPEDGGKKFADCIAGKIGTNGDLLGAPEGKTIGKITDQKPMNPAFTDPALREEFWNILTEVCGHYG